MPGRLPLGGFLDVEKRCEFLFVRTASSRLDESPNHRPILIRLRLLRSNEIREPQDSNAVRELPPARPQVIE